MLNFYEGMRLLPKDAQKDRRALEQPVPIRGRIFTIASPDVLTN